MFLVYVAQLITNCTFVLILDVNSLLIPPYSQFPRLSETDISRMQWIKRETCPLSNINSPYNLYHELKFVYITYLHTHFYTHTYIHVSLLGIRDIILTWSFHFLFSSFQIHICFKLGHNINFELLNFITTIYCIICTRCNR